MLITVAICTWNRADLLDKTLTKLRELRIPPDVTWELLVVNNNCTDDTKAVLARHEGQLPLRCLFESKQGLSNARNCAIEACRGDLLMWTDDDVLVDPGWLASLVECAARHRDAVAFSGPVMPWFQVEPDPDFLEVFPPLKIGFCGVDYGPEERELGPDELIPGANMTFRMERIRELRFNPNLGRNGAFLGGSEDYEYTSQVRETRLPIVWCPGMRLQHYVEPSRMSLKYLNAYYEGLGVTAIRMNGVPAGPRFAGVPRWLVRNCVTSYCRYLWARFTATRRQALEYLRIYHYRKGTIKGCREWHRQLVRTSEMPTPGKV
jgi:glycosyltransferase involved in cell wall biosynthesis